MLNMTPDDEVEGELCKSDHQLARDLIDEAMAKRGNDLDNVKHLLKRVGFHQIVLARQSRRTNCWLLVLSVLMVIGAVASVISAVIAILA